MQVSSVAMTEERRPFFKSDLFTFMPCLGLGILTVSTVFSAIKARNDLPNLAFIISIYVFLMLLFLCLHLHDRSPHDSQRRERLKIPIFVFSTILNCLFAHRVSMILPLPLDFLVWAMAAGTSFCGFYFVFLYRDNNSTGNSTAAAATTSGAKSKTGSVNAKTETGMTKLTKPTRNSEPFVGEKL